MPFPKPNSPTPSLFDIFLVVIGPVVFTTGFYLLIGSPWVVVQGFVVGCVLGALAWRWPRMMGPVLLVLSIPALAFNLFLPLYSGGMPNWLVSMWGSVTFLVGGLGVLRWRSIARRVDRSFSHLQKPHGATLLGWSLTNLASTGM